MPIFIHTDLDVIIAATVWASYRDTTDKQLSIVTNHVSVWFTGATGVVVKSGYLQQQICDNLAFIHVHAFVFRYYRD